MKGWRGNALLALVSLVLASGAAELGLRLAGYEALYDVYSRPELFWREDALLGWSLEPGARGRYRGPRPFPVEFDSEVVINSLGLRGPELAARPPGGLRVVLLGDSFVAGFEVEQDQTFAAQLGLLLAGRLGRPVEVVNAAVRGYGTDQSLLWYREHGRALRPDLVVAVFSANDFEDNVTLHRVRRPFGKGAFALRPSGGLELVGVPVPAYPFCSAWVLDAKYEPARIDGALSRAACWGQAQLADRSALFTLLATTLARMPALVRALQGTGEPEGALGGTLRGGASPVRTAGLPGFTAATATAPAGELTTVLLQELAREVRASGARFVLVMTPQNAQRVDLRALRADRIEPRSVALPPGVGARQIRFRNDGHLNVLGHRLFAEGLAPQLERELRAAAAR